jgi:cytochrome c peroxidase
MGYRLPSVCRRIVEASTMRSALGFFSPFIGVTGRPTCANCHQFQMGFLGRVADAVYGVGVAQSRMAAERTAESAAISLVNLVSFIGAKERVKAVNKHLAMHPYFEGSTPGI